MRVRISKQGKKIEAARQFNVEVVNHFKSHVAKLELEKEDLKREISRNMLNCSSRPSLELVHSSFSSLFSSVARCQIICQG